MLHRLPLFDNLLNHFSFFSKPSSHQAVLLQLQARQQLNQQLDTLNRHITYFISTVDVNAPLDDASQRTLLHWAAIQGNIQFFEELKQLKPNSQFDLKDVWQKTPLYYAVCHTQLNVVQFLLEQGADPRQPGLLPEALQVSANRPTCLMIIQLLLKHNAPVNEKDLLGDTLLHKATKLHDIALLKVLLQTGGIRSDLKNDEGKTALDLAITEGNPQVIQLLKHFSSCEASIPTTLHALSHSRYA
jgi:ankyrin repeat protein